MKLLLTYFWKRLPIGDLISLTPISLAFSKRSQIGPSSSNHLKSDRKHVSALGSTFSHALGGPTRSPSLVAQQVLQSSDFSHFPFVEIEKNTTCFVWKPNNTVRFPIDSVLKRKACASNRRNLSRSTSCLSQEVFLFLLLPVVCNTENSLWLGCWRRQQRLIPGLKKWAMESWIPTTSHWK